MEKTALTIEQLQEDWKEMFQKTLPNAATSKSPAQPKWPVHVDHCFARIILDAVVGVDSPWMDKIKSPAYRNMSREQLEQSIELGEKILASEVDLVELDRRSLEVRGKTKGVGKGGKLKEKKGLELKGEKRKRDSDGIDEQGVSKKIISSAPSKLTAVTHNPSMLPTEPRSQPTEDLTPYIKKIALSSLTPFRKRVLTALCQVPPGSYTTYGALATHLSSSPRAVGNALRNNPFAPHVPCHRVLAADGGIGGFHGSWGKGGVPGLNDERKRGLLGKEGVMFEEGGRVRGGVWGAWK